MLFGALFLAAVAVLGPPAGRAGGPVAGSAAVLAAALGAGWVLLWLEGRRAGELGFRLEGPALQESGVGLGIGVGLAVACVVVVVAAGGVRMTREPGTVGGLLGTGAKALWMLAFPAAAEEALFRGYPFQTLVRALGARPAVVLAGVAFGLLHGLNPHATWLGALNTGIAGVLLSVVYLRTASLWAATGVHLGWNWGLAFVADVPVSGLDLVDTPYLAVAPAGPTWVGGGAFGPEGGVAATVVAGVASVLLARQGWPGRGRGARWAGARSSGAVGEGTAP